MKKDPGVHQDDRRCEGAQRGELSPWPSRLRPSGNSESVEGAIRDLQQLGRAVHPPREGPEGVGGVERSSPVIHEGVSAVLGVHQQHGSLQHGFSILLKPDLPSPCTVVMAWRADDLHRSTALAPGHLGEIPSELDRGGDTRRVVAGALEEGVPVSNDDDPFRVLRSRRHLSNHDRGRQPTHFLHIEAEPQAWRLIRVGVGKHPLQGGTIVRPESQRWYRAVHVIERRLNIAR